MALESQFHPMGGGQNELFLNQEFQEVSGKGSLQGWQIRIREPRVIGRSLSFG